MVIVFFSSSILEKNFNNRDYSGADWLDFSYIGGKYIPRPRHTKTLQFSAVLQFQGLKVMGYVLNMPNVQKKCASPCKLDKNTVYLK